MTPEERRERRQFVITMLIWLGVIIGSFILSFLTARHHHG